MSAGLLLLLAAQAPPAAIAEPDDGRHWELISGLVSSSREASTMYADVSPDGNSIVYAAALAQPSSVQGGTISAFLARRSDTGWSSTDLGLPGSNGSPTLQQSTLPVVLPPGANQILVTARGQQDPSAPTLDPDQVRAYITTPGAATGTSFIRPPFQETSQVAVLDGQQTLAPVFFRLNLGSSDTPTLPADDGTLVTRHVIARRDANGALTIASRVDGAPTDELSVATASNEVALLGNFGTNTRNPVAGVARAGISVDGRRLYFNAYQGGGRQTQPTDAGGGPLQPLFVRDGDRTVAMSESEIDDQPKPARFLGASPDGDVSYFISNESLDADHEGAGVYRYQLSASSDPLTRLTPSAQNGAGQDATIDDLAIRSGAASRDGAAVYFVTEADMGGGAQPGGRNAYVWRGSQLRFIADIGADGGLLSVARSGRFALFSSTASLVGSDTGGFSQLYRYADEAAAGDRLRCASCRADGNPNQGPSALEGFGGTLTTFGSPPRGLSEDGRVFFTASDRLVAEDGSPAPDAYEYTGGGVRMLTNGVGTSAVMDNSDDGSSVYISSDSPLAPEDNDGLARDVYVRRAGSDIVRPSTTAPCQGEGCRGTPRPQLPGPAAGSLAPGPAAGRPALRRVAPKVLGRPSLSRSALRGLAAGRRVSVRIRVRGQGRLSVRGTARVGRARRVVLDGSATGRKAAARNASVSLALNALGRRELERRGTLVVRLEARFGSNRSRTSTVTLRRAGR